MGVYSRGWIEMLIAGGMSYHSARKLTGKLSKVIISVVGRASVCKKSGLTSGSLLAARTDPPDMALNRLELKKRTR